MKISCVIETNFQSLCYSKSQIKYEWILVIVAIVTFSIVFDYNARQEKKRYPFLLTEMSCRYKIYVPNLRLFRVERVPEWILQGCIAHCTQHKDLTFMLFLHLDWIIDENGGLKGKKEASLRMRKMAKNEQNNRKRPESEMPIATEWVRFMQWYLIWILSLCSQVLSGSVVLLNFFTSFTFHELITLVGRARHEQWACLLLLSI